MNEHYNVTMNMGDQIEPSDSERQSSYAPTQAGELESKNFKFVWKIDNVLKKLKKKQVALVSPQYTVQSSGKMIACHLWLHVMETILREEHFALHVLFRTGIQEDAFENYHAKLAFIDNNGQEVFVKKSGIQKLKEKPMWCVPNFIKKDDFIEIKDRLLCKGMLSVLCEIDINLYKDDEVDINVSLVNDYEALFLSEELSDISLVFEGQQIKAHKSILSARSKVFSKMLKRDISEENNIIEIKDVSFDVMKELLRFLYCGKVCCDKDSTKLLLVAAHKYDISLLKVECEKSLLKSLKNKNACEILALADFCSCEKMKKEAINFIAMNLHQIKSSSGFKKLKESHAGLVEEILCKFTNRTSTL